jgi:GNAT superfamily N-acetyltransferase
VKLGSRLWQALRVGTSPIGELTCAILFERSLAQPVETAANRLDATLRLASENDIDTICRLYAGDEWLWLGRSLDDRLGRDLYIERLRRGELCYIASVGGEVAHINWTCLAWGDALPGHPIRLRPGEVYTTDAFTPPRFRGKGIHAFVLGTMLDEARQRGARQAWTLGQLDRPAALTGLRALGWQECGRVIYFLPRGACRTPFLVRRGRTDPLFRH